MGLTNELYQIPNALINECERLINHCESKEAKLLAKDLKDLIKLLQDNNTVPYLLWHRNDIKSKGNSIRKRIINLKISNEASYKDSQHLANFFHTLLSMYCDAEYENTIFHADHLTIDLPGLGPRTANLKAITLSYYELINRKISKSPFHQKAQESINQSDYSEDENAFTFSQDTIEHKDSLSELKAQNKEELEVILCENFKSKKKLSKLGEKIINLFSSFDLGNLVESKEKKSVLKNVSSSPKLSKTKSSSKQVNTCSQENEHIKTDNASKFPTAESLTQDLDALKSKAGEQCSAMIKTGNEALLEGLEETINIDFATNSKNQTNLLEHGFFSSSPQKTESFTGNIQQRHSREPSEDSSTEEQSKSWELPDWLFWTLVGSIVGIPVLAVFYICKAIAQCFCMDEDEQQSVVLNI